MKSGRGRGGSCLNKIALVVALAWTNINFAEQITCWCGDQLYVAIITIAIESTGCASSDLFDRLGICSNEFCTCANLLCSTPDDFFSFFFPVFVSAEFAHWSKRCRGRSLLPFVCVHVHIYCAILALTRNTCVTTPNGTHAYVGLS